MNKRRLIAIVLCLVMVLALAACGGGTETPSSPATTAAPSGQGGGTPSTAAPSPGGSDTPAKRDSLSIGTTVDYGTLNCTQTGGDAFTYLMCVNETLWEMDLDGTLYPKLAESWEWVADDHMVVHLRQDVTFSNGNKFNVEDVLFTMQANKDGPPNYSQPRVQTTDFERTKAIDEFTLDWYLKAPSVLHWTVGSDMPILDKESYSEETAATRPIGTGPYVVTDYVVNSYIQMERRDDYWGELPAIKNLTFRVLAEPSQRVNAVETGLVDIAPIAMADVEYVKSLDNVQLRTRSGSSWLAMGFNISADGKLADPDARFAIMAAIDREAIASLVYYNLAYVMNSPFTAANIDHEERFEKMGPYGTGFNLEKAKELADKSGLTGQTIVLANNGSTEHIAAAEMVQSMLEKIGVTVQINSYDTASFSEVQQDKTLYDITLRNGMCPNMRVGDNLVNAVKFNKIWCIPENWANDHGARFFEIHESSLTTIDDSARSEILYELMGYYCETNPTFAICGWDNYTAYSNDLDLSTFRERAVGTAFYAWQFQFK